MDGYLVFVRVCHWFHEFCRVFSQVFKFHSAAPGLHELDNLLSYPALVEPALSVCRDFAEGLCKGRKPYQLPREWSTSIDEYFVSIRRCFPDGFL